MAKIDYPVDEFLRDFQELQDFLRKDSEKDGALSVADGDPYPFEWVTFRSADWAKRKYPNWKVCFVRLSTLTLVFSYVSQHFSDFDTGDFAVYGSDKVGGLVGNHVLRALHQVYTVHPPSDKQISPDQIKAIARTFKPE